jgi:hypothetical protein
MRRSRSRPPAPRSSFTGFRFPPEVITVAVRWYLRYGLSYRDVEELLAERGIEVDHSTVSRRSSVQDRLTGTGFEQARMAADLRNSSSQRGRDGVLPGCPNPSRTRRTRPPQRHPAPGRDTDTCRRLRPRRASHTLLHRPRGNKAFERDSPVLARGTTV